MGKLLILLMLLSDVGLATGVFVALAKPDVVIALSFRLSGFADDWFQEHVGEEELRRLRNLVRLGSWLGLGTLFGWSFAVGVVATTLRLSGS